MNNSLKINSIETLGTHEGPGIRFVIFTQGCNYKCLYCHNPETRELNGGKLISIDELIGKVKKCQPYFGEEGGVTVSGGEPLLQSKELALLFSKLKKLKIKTALDTNGSLLTEDTKRLLNSTDLVLLDVKHIDNEWHKKITGRQNDMPLRFAEYLERNNIKFWIRYVLVPNLTDQDELIKKLAEHFKSYKNLERVEILPYHTLGIEKYEKLGMKYSLLKTPIPNEKLIVSAKRTFEKYFDKVTIR